MRHLDETDLEILSILAADGRRSFSDIGDAVDLTGPAVSERVTRLREVGVIERFTIDVDRSQLQAGIPIFVRAEPPVDTLERCREQLTAAEAVEHVFVTADGDLWFTARTQVREVHRWLQGLFDGIGDVQYEVTLLDEMAWHPSLDGMAFALTCDECGNTVDQEGESARFGPDVYHFCCSSCLSRFEERYDRLTEEA